MSWDGRTLTSQTLSNGTVLSYAYNSSGIRTQKTYGASYRKDYLLDGTTIVAEIKTNLSNNSKETIYYFYDETGVAGFEYNGAKYHYVKNLQGDIISIQNANGIVVVNYAYDAWGNVLSISGTSAVIIGTLNPFRYRGYYYDTETGYYYLNSRYYDPVVGRFVNADGYVSTGQGILGNNMYAYCGNNPVTRFDSEGDFWVPVILGVIAIGAILLTGCTDPNDSSDSLVDTPADPAPNTYFYDLNEAVMHQCNSVYLDMMNYRDEHGHFIEYSCIVFKFKKGTAYDPNRYYCTDSITQLKDMAVRPDTGVLNEDDIEIVAFIHSHPSDKSEKVQDGVFVLNDQKYNEKYNATSYVVEPTGEIWKLDPDKRYDDLDPAGWVTVKRSIRHYAYGLLSPVQGSLRF